MRFLDKDEFDIFLDLYRETEARTGFVSKTDQYFYNFINHYGDKVLLPLAYIDLDEYIEKFNTHSMTKKIVVMI